MGAAKAEIVTGCHVLGAEDSGDPIWGHVSRRDPDGHRIRLKAGPRGFDEVTADDIIAIGRR
jgi:ribulose-5-phosphate 4-epimerase/fuculose-1-phosphate aldolase